MSSIVILVAAAFCGAAAAILQRPGLLAVGCFLIGLALVVDIVQSAQRADVQPGFPADRVGRSSR